MQIYSLTCVLANGSVLAAELGEYDSLIDALDALAETCVFDDDARRYRFAPLPGDCRAWELSSNDGFELAAKHG